MNLAFRKLVLKSAVLLMTIRAFGADERREAEGTGAKVSIEALVQEALEKNPELNYYRAEIGAAKGERRTAGTLANPELTAQAGLKHARSAESGLAGEGLAWSASVQQTFEYPGRLALRKAIANQQIGLAELGFERFRVALMARTRAAAFSVFAAQEKERAAREVAERFGALTEVLVQREPAGITPLLETRIIEANAVTAHRKASEASQAVQTAMLELNQLRGEKLATQVSIQKPEVGFREKEPVEKLMDRAATNSFELRIRQMELEQQGFKLSLANHERYPSISVGPYASQEESGQVGEKQTIVGLGISVPLPLWNRNGGNIEVARAREQQATVSLRLAQREVERKVIESARALEARLLEMSRWAPDSIGKLQEAAALADRHYRLGAVPLQTYVELQKQYLEALEAILDTKQDALRAAQDLELQTGARMYITAGQGEAPKAGAL